MTKYTYFWQGKAVSSETTVATVTVKNYNG